MIYLDYQATTPLAPEARDAMLPYLGERFGNPHSAHRLGREAHAAVELARERIFALLPKGGQLAFTSGATESLNWAMKGLRGPIVTFETEHAAVLDTAEAIERYGHEVALLPVKADGLVDCSLAEQFIQPGLRLAAAMLVNNEIGVIQPVEALAEQAHRAGALFLCDAAQGFGRVSLPENCDLIAISSHKIHGPKGIGALWIRDGVTLEPLLHGGGQEVAGRSGTLAPALCAGFGVAASLMADRMEQDSAHVEQLWSAATSALSEDWVINGSSTSRYRGNLNLRLDGLDVARLMADLRDIAFSAGSACASGSGRPSHVLSALGLTDKQARSSIRLGFGRYTTQEELVAAVRRIDEAARQQARFAA